MIFDFKSDLPKPTKYQTFAELFALGFVCGLIFITIGALIGIGFKAVQ